MLRGFVRACAIKAGGAASITEQNIKDALIALTSSSVDPKCRMMVDLNFLPVTLAGLKKLVDKNVPDPSAQIVPNEVLRPEYRP